MRKSSAFLQLRLSQPFCRLTDTQFPPARGKKIFHIGSGVVPENIIDSRCGTRREVLLWPDWSAIYDDLTRFNDLLILLPSPSVILGATWQGVRASHQRGGTKEFFRGLLLEPGYSFREFRATEAIRNAGRSFSISAFDHDGATALKICLRPGQSVQDFADMVALNQGIGSSSPVQNRVTPGRSGWCSGLRREPVSSAPSIETCFKLWIHAGIRIRVTLSRPHLSLSCSFVPTEWRRDSHWLYVSDGQHGLNLDEISCKHPVIQSGCVASGKITIPTAASSTLLTIQTEGLG